MALMIMSLLGEVGARAGWTQAPEPTPATPNAAAPAPALVPSPGRFVPRVAAHSVTANGKNFAVLTINATEAATIRTAAGGLSPQQRADAAAQRLTSLLQGGLAPDEISARVDNKPTWAVTARGGTLLLATSDEAAAHNNRSPRALARAWVKALRTLVAQPPLALPVSSLIVPLGEQRTVKMGGAALPADVIVHNDNDAVSMTSYDPATRLLTVQGRAAGHSAVLVQLAPGKGTQTLSLPVAVMKYAGRVAPSETIQVTGNPSAPPGLVTQAAYLGLTRALGLEPGAQIALADAPRAATSLTLGSQTGAAFPLHLTGSDLLPVTACPQVTVVNTPVTQQTPATLLYSNNPEQVKHVQTLFVGRLRASSAARVDYHHQNMSGQLLVFHVDLLNDTDTPDSVQVIAGLSLPGADTVQVGRRAASVFLKNLNGNCGIVLDVPPHGRISLVTQRFGPGLTVSGLLQLQSLSGGPLTLRVSAGGDTDTLAAPLSRMYLAGVGGSALAAPSGGSGLTAADIPSAYVFPKPQIALSGKYTVDKRWTFIEMGNKEALHSSSGKIKLYGNYGADYEVTLTLTNPTHDARQVGVYFAPGAGPAAAVFQVDDGPILEYDPFEPPNERELARVSLAPGETKVMHLRTIPLNGSAYPAELIARALDKKPAPPVAVPAATAILTAAPPGKASH